VQDCANLSLDLKRGYYEAPCPERAGGPGVFAREDRDIFMSRS
jgi:hypothetical protein